MWTLEDSVWYRGSYADALKFFFNHFDSKEAIVFRDIRGRGLCKDLQFIALVERKKLKKFLISS
jgi:hypothetical protein